MKKFAGLLIFLIVLLSIGCGPKEERYVLQETTPIVSLDRSVGVHGDFVLGFGTVRSGAFYFAYKPTGENRFELIQVPATGEESVKTEVVESGRTEVRRFVRQYRFSKNGEWSDEPGGCGCNPHYYKYEIHVPKGSVVKEFHP